MLMNFLRIAVYKGHIDQSISYKLRKGPQLSHSPFTWRIIFSYFLPGTPKVPTAAAGMSSSSMTTGSTTGSTSDSFTLPDLERDRMSFNSGFHNRCVMLRNVNQDGSFILQVMFSAICQK